MILSKYRKVRKIQYDKTFKEAAVKLSDEIGVKAATLQLGIPYYTLSGWRNNRKKYGPDYMTEIIVYTVIYASYVILRLRKAVLKSKKAKAKIAQMVKEA